MGMKRLADFFRNPAKFDFSPYIVVSFHKCISPWLASLDQENTQAPSILLELFFVWMSKKEYTAFLIDYDDCVMPQVYTCLIAPAVKPAIVSRILDIVDRLLSLSMEEGISDHVVKPRVTTLLRNLAVLVERTKQDASAANPLVQRQINILSGVSRYLTDSKQATMLLTLLSPLLHKPTRLVGEKVEANMLKIVSSLLPLIPALTD